MIGKPESDRRRKASSTEYSQLDALVKSILRRWPHHKMDDDQVGDYWRDLADLIEECGLTRLQAATRAARTRCDFYPGPAELRALLPSPEQFLQHRDPDCHNCLGSGWRAIEVAADKLHLEVYPRSQTMRRAERCCCQPPPRAEQLA